MASAKYPNRHAGRSPSDLAYNEIPGVTTDLLIGNNSYALLTAEATQLLFAGSPNQGAIKLMIERLKSEGPQHAKIVQFANQTNLVNVGKDDPDNNVALLQEELKRSQELLGKYNARALRLQLEALLRRLEQGDNSVPDQLLRLRRSEQEDDLRNKDTDTDTVTDAIPAANLASSELSDGRDKFQDQNPAIEDSDNTLPGLNSNADPVILRQARENLVLDNTLSNINSSVEDGYTVAKDGNNANEVNNGVTFMNEFSQKITTSKNALMEFAHYTYKIGLYLQTPQQYRNMMITKSRSTQGLPKILESGGTGGNNNNAIFPDVHIENLEIESLMPNNTGGAHNAVNITFDIHEPMGFTLIPKLKRLCDANGMTGYSKQHYLLVIKFQGYDENGSEVITDDNDALTKFIPFVFTAINTTVATGGVVYRCQARPPTYNIGISQKRTTIQSQFEVLGRTLNDVFNAGGDSTSSLTQSIGVVKAMNDQQQDYLDKDTIQIKDVFEVEFLGGIGDFKVLQPGSTSKDKTRTAMGDGTSAYNTVSNQGMDKTKQKFATVAGMPMQQFIQLMVENSEYVTKQQKAYKDPKTKQIVANTEQGKFLQWFNISMETTPIEFDEKRNDYAYHIKYVISPKKIEDPKSANFQKAPFRGVHKKYTYWFTGENSEVLDYEQEINTQFYAIMSGDVPEPVKENTIDTQDESQFYNQSKGGLPGYQADGISDVGSVTNLLYSPVDFQRSEMTIFGDPDFLQQAEIFYSPGDFQPFMPDGSVNTETSEVLYEVFFRTMEDYNDGSYPKGNDFGEDNGSNPGEAILRNPNLKSKQEIEATGTQGLIYRLIRLTTYFSKGVMTQKIHGLLREFYRNEGKRNTDSGREINSKRNDDFLRHTTKSTVDTSVNSYANYTSAVTSTKVINADQDGNDALAAMRRREKLQEEKEKRKSTVFPLGGGA